MRRSEPAIVSVVVPARDEETLLPTALHALRAARLRVPHISVDITVVADQCTDRTAEVAADLGADVVEIDAGNVGAARAAGFAAALRRHAGSTHRQWLATTDADSRVPAGWLGSQLHAARLGYDVFCGTVVLAPLDRNEFAAWVKQYFDDAAHGTHHGHIHGANLGLTATCYEAIGGFSPLSSGEDVDLIHRCDRGGAKIAWSTAVPVTTSARREARAPNGVAADLALQAQGFRPS